MTPDKAIIITGNPIDGLDFYGPFANIEEAINWAESELSNIEWWAANLTDVEEED